MRANQPMPRWFSMVFEGKTYEATYTARSNLITVTSQHGSKSTQAGRLGADAVAQTLLAAILTAAKDRGDL